MFDFMNNPIWWLKLSISLQILIPIGCLSVRSLMEKEFVKRMRKVEADQALIKEDYGTAANDERIEKNPVNTTKSFIEDMYDFIGWDNKNISIYCRITDDKTEYGYKKENGEYIPIFQLSDGGIYSAQACYRRTSYILLLDCLIRYIDTSINMNEIPVINEISPSWLNYTKLDENQDV